jgi:hypothetical protein
METRRGEIAAELSAIPESMRDLRVALERCQALGVSGARTDLEVAVAAARTRTRGASGEEAV